MPKIQKPLATAALKQVWPYNLAFAVYTPAGRSNQDDNEPWEQVHRTYIPGLVGAYYQLTEREQQVLADRYMGGLTLEDTGKRYNVTRERIRQIEAKALRKLRHPKYQANYILVPAHELRAAEATISGLMQEIARLHEIVPLLPETEGSQDLDSMDIADLDLSVRSYNCLRRVGYHTVGSLRGVTIEQLMRVRNLGRKSAGEIVSKLRAFGVEVGCP